MRHALAELPRHLGVGRRFRALLTVAGVLGAVALAAPPLVMLGFFAGILPGLILLAAPSAFLYMLTWYAVFAILLVTANFAGIALERWIVRFLAGIAAAAVLVLVAIAVPRAVNASIDQAIAELQADDRSSADPIAVPSVVAITLPGSMDDQPACDTLCQRLLYNGLAGKVIMAEDYPRRSSSATPTAYWIERRDTCPRPVLRRLDVVWPGDSKQKAAAASRVRARISAGECLVSAPAAIEDAQLTVDFRTIKKGASALGNAWNLTLDTVNVNRLEIARSDGELLYRRTEIAAEPLAAPLLLEMRAGLLTTVTYAGWARTRRVASQLGPNGRDVLPTLLGEAARVPDPPPAQPQTR